MDPVNDKDKNFDDLSTTNFKPWGMEVNQFCMLMHLAQLAGYIVPFAGLVLPIVMWATNKDHSDVVDQHGKSVLNWIISSMIYMVISAILIFVLIGIPLIFVVAICTLIFSILGAVKASNGEFYKYPLTITFIK